MNKIKKLSSILLITFLIALNSNVVYSESKNSIIEKCFWTEWYDAYKCKMNKICLNQEFWKQTDKVIKLDKFYLENTPLEKSKEIYRKNQNSIFKCSILNTQKTALEQLVEKLSKQTDKTWLIKNKVIPKINVKKQQIETIKSQNKCNSLVINYNKKKLKKVVLDQSTLELCNYRYYLDYLNDSYYADINNVFDKTKESQNSALIASTITNIENQIEDEIKHSYKLHNLSYESFIQYDTFIKIHIILELLKEDYRVYRDKLYQTLHPINQLVYKIINAQSK